MSFLIESLESRQFLSASPLALAHAHPLSQSADTSVSNETETETENENENESQDVSGSDQGQQDSSGSGDHSAQDSIDSTDHSASHATGSVSKATLSLPGSFQALARKLLNLTGNWAGTVNVVGVHSRPVTLTISKQASNGKLKGTLIPVQDTSIHVAFSGQLKTNRSISVKLVGSHSGGAINGSGTGKVSPDGKSINVSMKFVQGTQTFKGSLVLARA